MSETAEERNRDLARYEELLLARDQLEKEADQILINYTLEFGEEENAAFEEKIECIRLKKSIAYCQAAVNRGTKIDQAELKEQLDRQMAMYYAELSRMTSTLKSAKTSEPVSKYEVLQVKKIYRKLAKCLHPDMNPKIAEEPELAVLWVRIASAYHGNDLKTLKELEVLAAAALKKAGFGESDPEIPDISEKIAGLEEEIHSIMTENPYLYKTLLEDPAAVMKKHSEYEEELKRYKAYHAELEQILDRLVMSGGAGIVWKIR